MKVLALTSNFRICGKGIAAHNICDALAKRGHAVRLEVHDSDQELKGLFKESSYEVHYRPSVPPMPSTGLLILKQVLSLLRLQRGKGFDVALVLDSSNAAAMGTAFSKEAGIPVACLGWGNELQELGRAERGFLGNCDLFIPVSRWAKTRSIEADLDESRTKVLPPGVDLDLFRPAKEVGKGLRIVTVTDLVKGCGVDQVMEVTRALLERGRDPWLTVVGTGPELKGLKAQAKKGLVSGSIKFQGGVLPSMMPGVLQGHHVFALVPKKVRGMVPRDISLVMMEASACGLGIVGTGTGGIGDSLRMSNGTRVPSENVERMADAVEKVAMRAGVTEEEHARMRSWEEVALELEIMLDDLVYE